MLLLEGIRIAIHALVAHKLRSALTLLGTIIAVLSIIAVVSIIQGMNLYVEEKIASLGSNVFSVRRGPFIVLSHEEGEKIAKRRRITMEDAEAIRRLVGSAQYVGASTGTSTLVARRELHIESVSIRGRSKFYGLLADFDLDTGRFFSPPEVDRSRPVVVLGWAVADKLFPRIDPMGKKIKIAGTHFQVIGVAEERGNVLGQSRDEFVAIPITTFQKLFGRRRSISIPVKTADLESFDQAREEAILVMRTRHHLKPNQEDDFAVETSESILSFWKTMSAMIFQVSGGVVSLSLVIGGIVIMNIMLVSVSERRKEIGLRRSLGATRRDILWHFLLEALAVCITGGLIGEAVGFILALLLREFTPFPATIKIWVAVAGLLLSSLIALIFGIYPAVQAARLDPAVALRAE